MASPSIDLNNLPDAYEDTWMHWHSCRNCGTPFTCCDPLCSGGCFDTPLCPDCFETLKGIW